MNASQRLGPRDEAVPLVGVAVPGPRPSGPTSASGDTLLRLLATIAATRG